MTRLMPLFPGYMFVSIELNTAPWHKIRSTRGVSRLICQNGLPKRFPFEIVSSLMSRCDSLGKLVPSKLPTNGDSVQILSGALANFVATVENIDSMKRIWLLMDIMGQSTRVQVASEQIYIVD